MKFQCQFIALWLCTMLGACAQVSNEEEEVVASSPTNPIVKQRAVSKPKEDEEVNQGEPQYRPPRQQQVQTVRVPTGSLFDPDRAVGLYELHQNFAVGDMILIELDETTSSQKSVDYNSDKSSSFEIQPVTVNAGPIHISDDDLNLDHAQDGEFSSSADAKQSNSLQGRITVYVVEILPNNNLVVAGEKWITLNKGKEFIRFSGEVRKQDIDVNNTVSSSKVGNATIEYSGKGDLQDNQNRSVLDKLFSIFG